MTKAEVATSLGSGTKSPSGRHAYACSVRLLPQLPCSLLQPPWTLRSLLPLGFCEPRIPCWEMRPEGSTVAILRILLGNKGICGVNTPLFTSLCSHKTSVRGRRTRLTFCKLSSDTTVRMTQHLYSERVKKKDFLSTSIQPSHG